MKLRTKFAIGLLLATLVLSAGVYGGLELYKDQLIEQSRDDVNETARLTAGQLDFAIQDRKDFVGFVASRPEAARFDQSDQFLRDFVENSRFFAAQTIDENGTIVDFHGDVTQRLQEESIGSNVADRPYVASALNGEVYVSDPEYVNATEKYLVVVSAPIFEDREIRGVLASAIYLDRQTLFGVLGPLSRHDQRVTVTAGSSVLFSSGGQFDQTIQSTATVDATGWRVTVRRDRGDLVSQLRQLAIAQGLGILLVMSSAIAFGIWEYRTALSQTEQLLDGFSALEDGVFDYELSLAAADEWEQISDGFNALAASLADREAAIRQREQRLQVLNRVLRHNLRNNAAIAIGYAGFIEERTEDPEVLAAAASIEETGINLETISEKAKQLELTVQEQVEPTPLDVPTLVQDALVDVQTAFPETNISASLPTHAWVLGGPSLETAIANICENACEHNDAEAPELDVSVDRRPETVAIVITDNGGGIPEYERSVLDAGEETPLEHASGLGLWVAKWAVERYGGTLEFTGTEGSGSTVTIELPRAEPVSPADSTQE